jgi:hypothetical protein
MVQLQQTTRKERCFLAGRKKRINRSYNEIREKLVKRRWGSEMVRALENSPPNRFVPV